MDEVVGAVVVDVVAAVLDVVGASVVVVVGMIISPLARLYTTGPNASNGSPRSALDRSTGSSAPPKIADMVSSSTQEPHAAFTSIVEASPGNSPVPTSRQPLSRM